MKKLYFFLIVFLSWFFLPVFAQQNNDLPLPLHEVLLKIQQQHKINFNYLDDDISEIRIIPPKDSFSLSQKIKYLGQKTGLDFYFVNPKSISISKGKDNKKPETIIATSNIETLQEVTIDNYLTTGIIKKTDGSFLIKPQQFGVLPGLTEPDVLQTMQQIPGIISVDETISNINVRGGTQDQNLFTWNGVRMFQTGHFFGLISAFNPLLAQEIRIYKNGSPAFFGESVSSIVSISTKTDSIENSRSAIEANLISTSFYSKIRLSEKSSFTISGRRSLTDLITTPTYRNYADRIFQNTIITNLDNNQIVDYEVSKKFYFYDFSVQFRQKIGAKNELILDAIGISNSLNIDQNKLDQNEIVQKNSQLEQQNYGANLNWTTKWNTNNATFIHLYGSYYNLDSDNESLESNQKSAQQNTVLDTGIRLENQHSLNDNFNFSNGYQYNETGIANYDKINLPEFSRRVKDVLRIHTIVLESEYNSNNRKIFVKTGLRTNYIEEFSKPLFEPRLQFNYSFTKNLKLEVLGEFKSQTASQVIDLQRDFLGVEKRRWLLSDNAKNPIQQSRQIAVGMTFKNKKWIFTVDNFYKKINGISSSGQSFQNQLEFLKINGNYTVWGSELLVQRNFNRFYTWIIYSWNHNEYEFPDYVPPQFPNNFEMAHTVSWAGIYDHENLKIALGAKWFSGKPETTPQNLVFDSANPILNYNNPNNDNLADYFQVNLSASHLWKLSKTTDFTASFSIQNLLNKRNIINRYYRINTSENTIESVNTYSLERTPNLSVKINF